MAVARKTDTLLQQRRDDLATALLACHGRTPKRAVHDLRKAGNRMAALVEKDVADHPASKPLRKRAQRMLRQLRKLRSLAGEVRDLDVHLDLARSLLRGRTGELHAQLTALLSDLKIAREEAAAALRDALPKRETKVEEALEEWIKVRDTLPPSGYAALPVAQNWWSDALRRHAPVTKHNLHDLRKDSKRARYLAETGSAPARALAQQLHRFSNAAGIWHDWVMLRDRARQHMPKGSEARVLLKDKVQGHLERALVSARRLSSAVGGQ